MKWLQLIQGYRGKLSAMRTIVWLVITCVLVPALFVGAVAGNPPRFTLADAVLVIGALMALAIHVGREPRS